MMNKILLISFLAMLFFSCEKPEDNDEPKKPTVEEDCVPVSEITSTQDSFYMFYTGDQAFGSAKGIKINKEFEASVKTYEYKTDLVAMLIGTYWNLQYKYSNADQIFIRGWKNESESKGCYYLSNHESSEDSIHCEYRLADYDIVVSEYLLDMDSINKIEIIDYNPDNLKVKAKLSAHFITDDFLEPLIPERVSFLNVEIEARKKE